VCVSVAGFLVCLDDDVRVRAGGCGCVAKKDTAAVEGGKG
jgi:hypothetical protein